MKKNALWMLPALALVACGSPKEEVEKQTWEQMKVNYPETQKGTVVDSLWGTEVADPYRWLEDDMSEETKSWVERQNEVTFAYLDKIPYRDAIKDHLTKVWNYEKRSAPFKRGDWYYFYKNDGLQNQSVIYRQKEGGEEEVFLDPNSFSDDGTTSLGGMSFTEDGSILAYQISEGGSDWRKVIIMDAESKEVMEDTLVDIKFSGTSWKGNEGFYYSSYDKPEGSELSAKTSMHKLYFHKLGTPQSDDKLIFGGETTPRRYISGYVSEDNRFLFISASISTTGNELYVQKLNPDESALATTNPIVPIVNNVENTHGVAHVEGDELYISTNLDAPNKRLVKVNVNEPAPENWVDVIPETEMPLSMSTGGGYLFAQYLKDATTQVIQYNLDGTVVREIELPAVGSAGGFGSKWEETEMYYSFSNYVYPSTIFKYDATTGKSEVFFTPEIDFDPNMYESKQVFYASKDGTKIPMILTYKKGLEMNGKNPTMLYGYGGFNISLTPSFSVSRIPWLENGGIWAVANLRGGGEYGEEWHSAGTQMNKQNVFDDFISAGEFLIEKGYTSSDYLAVKGGSNGGLLVGSTMTQRPDLMAVALPAVGVLDMLRYHKFTAGAGWAYDYGTADDSKEMFDYLYAYSPVHNAKAGVEYPATMVTTGDHDDRVVPAHSHKFTSSLQAVQTGSNPVFTRINVNAGHGAGKPTDMRIAEIADELAFSFYNMKFTELPAYKAEKTEE